MNHFLLPGLGLRFFCLFWVAIAVTATLFASSTFAVEDEGVRAIPEPIPSVLSPALGGGVRHAIVVEKSSQQLFLYGNSDTGSLKKILEFPCSTGKAHGPKTNSGDAKTPEGIYFFGKIYQKKELSPIYGVMAFTTDYPNLLDQNAGRTGTAIWLHGTNKPLKPYDSNGCIVLDDSHLLQVAPYIELNQTPIIIVENLSYTPYRSQSREILTGLINGWHQSMTQGAYHDYLSYYDADYLPDISWWPEWATFRRRLAQFHPFTVSADDIAIFNTESLFVALFAQQIHAADQSYHGGIRKLFFQEDKGRFKIIGDDYQALPDNLQAPDKTHPLLMISKRIPIIRRLDQEISAMLNKWLTAWSKGDIQTYGKYYARNFISDNMNRTEWLARKQQLAQKYDYIEIFMKQPEIRDAGEKRVVSFIQDYKSSGYRTVGKKMLTLIHEDGQWKIYREAWEKM